MEKPKLFSCIQQLNSYITQYVEKELIKHKLPNIKYSHYEILRLLHIKQKMTMKDISEAIFKHKSTVTALIQKLHKHGYINQTQKSSDKRVQFITLTSKGTQLKSLINTIEQKLLLKLHQQVSLQEQNWLTDNLSKLLPEKTLT